MIKESIKDEIQLIIEAKQGNKKSLEELIMLHDPYIKMLARKITPNYLKHDEDATYQEGILGLIKAVERFDENCNYKFLTFATEWISGFMVRYIQENRSIRLPVYVLDKLKKIKNFKKDFYKENLRYPTDLEIVNSLDLTLKDLNNLILNTQDLYSINFKYDNSNDNDNSLEAHLNNPNSSKFEKDVELSECRGIIIKILNTYKFNEIEKNVLYHFYGFDGNSMTLQDIGNMNKISKERVRQIKEKALKKLRQSEITKEIEDYIGRNNILNEIRTLYINYCNSINENAFINSAFIDFYINNHNKNLLFDSIMINGINKINNYRSMLLNLINNKEKDSNKIKYFLESLKINVKNI